tara:strand:- start:199 stop:1059 length:861 start_codon:yes stop_codon:yes gene_type:complete
MKNLKYFLQFIIIYIFFLFCKILGYKRSSDFGSFIGKFFGPLFRSKKIITKNLKLAYPKISNNEIDIITNNMWKNYGRILSDYVFIKDFRKLNLDNYIKLENEEIIKKIKSFDKPVVFISGHFNNFELLAMKIEMLGINLSAIYRPLNNFFLNKIMMNIRTKYICKSQIPKGLSGLKKSLNFFKNGSSLALMIDQRVSEGESVNFFNHKALTTTIPAQFVKKFKCLIVPVYIERVDKYYFKVKIDEPLKFDEKLSVNQITQELNNWLEKKINHNPSQWIWTHNRWK